MVYNLGVKKYSSYKKKKSYKKIQLLYAYTPFYNFFENNNFTRINRINIQKRMILYGYRIYLFITNSIIRDISSED